MTIKDFNEILIILREGSVQDLQMTSEKQVTISKSMPELLNSTSYCYQDEVR